MQLRIELLDFDSARPGAILLAFQRDLNIHDAVYLVVSKTPSVPLVIADLRLYDRIGDLPLITLLTEL